ncbi:hypothetical protein BDW66DRAFT_132748 [Aspergillus desertorum]
MRLYYRRFAARCILALSQSRTLRNGELATGFPGCSCLDSGVLRTAGVKRGESSPGLSGGPDPDGGSQRYVCILSREHSMRHRSCHTSCPPY